MKLYLSVDTDIEDLEIDYIEVKLVTGETVMVDWDESDIARRDDGFDASYKNVYFDEEYADGKLSSLLGMQIEYINLFTESDSDSDIVITDMTFEDEGEQYTPEHLLPYVISDSEEEFDIETCCRAAEDGSADAQYELGECYFMGTGVEQDTEKALMWYKRAAEQGHAEALCSLALCYKVGLGVAPNPDASAQHYEASAKKVHAAAQCSLD